jgi:prepilin-type processing-associated H-X9-DG protein
LIVIAIIVILIALLMPVLGSARARMRQTECASHLTQFGIGLQNARSRDVAIPGWTAAEALAPYIESSQGLFDCPDQSTDIAGTVSYGFNGRLKFFGTHDSGKIVALDFGVKVAEPLSKGDSGADPPTDLATRWPKVIRPRHFEQSNVLFYDGHVVAMNPDDLRVDERVLGAEAAEAFCEQCLPVDRPAAAASDHSARTGRHAHRPRSDDRPHHRSDVGTDDRANHRPDHRSDDRRRRRKLFVDPGDDRRQFGPRSEYSIGLEYE